MYNMKKVIILFFVFLEISSNIDPLQGLNNLPPAVPVVHFGTNQAVAALSVDDWDHATFHEVANEVFNLGLPALAGANLLNLVLDRAYNTASANIALIINELNVNARGYNIGNLLDFLDWISEERLRNRDINHTALARVVIADVLGNSFSYPIPYIFLSGENADRFISRIRNVAATEAIRAHINFNRNFLANAGLLVLNNNLHIVNAIARHPGFLLSLICKNNADYGFSSNNVRLYAHSERTIGVCLSSLHVPPLLADDYSMQNIVNYHIARYGQIASAIIQIKTSLPACNICQAFWNDDAWVFDNPVGETFCDQNTLNARAYTAFTQIENLAGIAQNLHLRISLRPFLIGR